MLIENNKKEYLEEFEKLKEASVWKGSGTRNSWWSWFNFRKCKYIASIPEIRELNIGHFLISQAVFDGIEKTINTMRL